jgi:hypothetical protein
VCGAGHAGIEQQNCAGHNTTGSSLSAVLRERGSSAGMRADGAGRARTQSITAGDAALQLDASCPKGAGACRQSIFGTVPSCANSQSMEHTPSCQTAPFHLPLCATHTPVVVCNARHDAHAVLRHGQAVPLLRGHICGTRGAHTCRRPEQGEWCERQDQLAHERLDRQVGKRCLRRGIKPQSSASQCQPHNASNSAPVPVHASTAKGRPRASH